MRSLVLAAVLAFGGAGFAAAEGAGDKPHVVVCAKDGMAERALKRDHGAVAWTTSAEVLAAVREARGWSTPRCISKLEHWRVTEELSRVQQAQGTRLKARQMLAAR